jgi:hypothetical protein
VIRATLFSLRPVELVRPGEVLLGPDGWLEVDSVTLRIDVVEVAGWPEGRRSSRRTTLRLDPGSFVEVEPSPSEAAQLLTKYFALELDAEGAVYIALGDEAQIRFDLGHGTMDPTPLVLDELQELGGDAPLPEEPDTAPLFEAAVPG